MWNEVTVTILSYKTKYYPVINRLTFEQLLQELKPRLDYQVIKHSGKLPGYDDDDIRQELMIYLWEKLNKRPDDMHLLDYRFTRWCESLFNQRILEIHRSMQYIRRIGSSSGPRIVEGYRDGLACSWFVDTIDDMVDDSGQLRYQASTSPSLEV